MLLPEYCGPGMPAVLPGNAAGRVRSDSGSGAFSPTDV